MKRLIHVVLSPRGQKIVFNTKNAFYYGSDTVLIKRIFIGFEAILKFEPFSFIYREKKREKETERERERENERKREPHMLT